MPLNIKNPRTERLVRELASATGESVTQAVATAVDERLHRLGAAGDAAAERRRRLHRIAHDAAARWVEPFASGAHGELLYDEAGVPR